MSLPRSLFAVRCFSMASTRNAGAGTDRNSSDFVVSTTNPLLVIATDLVTDVRPRGSSMSDGRSPVGSPHRSPHEAQDFVLARAPARRTRDRVHLAMSQIARRRLLLPRQLKRIITGRVRDDLPGTHRPVEDASEHAPRPDHDAGRTRLSEAANPLLDLVRRNVPDAGSSPNRLDMQLPRRF